VGYNSVENKQPRLYQNHRINSKTLNTGSQNRAMTAGSQIEPPFKISTRTENCDYNKYYLIEESVDSNIYINLRFERIVSIQSKKIHKEQLYSLIQDELSKFKWIICGDVNIDLTWYLSAVQRQETDKIGDMDNITKPILDSLIGINGVLIDDSQIGALYTYWLSRNELSECNSLEIKISFCNDYCLDKHNLIFVQYSNAICLTVNVDFTDQEQLFGTLFLLKNRQLSRTTARIMKLIGTNADSYLVRSAWDFHRSRLNQFSESVYSVLDFKEICRKNGLTFLSILRLLKKARDNK
jgi:Holliday junction resolvase RusA-like endonuclease